MNLYTVGNQSIFVKKKTIPGHLCLEDRGSQFSGTQNKSTNTFKIYFPQTFFLLFFCLTNLNLNQVVPSSPKWVSYRRPWKEKVQLTSSFAIITLFPFMIINSTEYLVFRLNGRICISRLSFSSVSCLQLCRSVIAVFNRLTMESYIFLLSAIFSGRGDFLTALLMHVEKLSVVFTFSYLKRIQFFIWDRFLNYLIRNVGYASLDTKYYLGFVILTEIKWPKYSHCSDKPSFLNSFESICLI